jgi:hypothetical protein
MLIEQILWFWDTVWLWGPQTDQNEVEKLTAELLGNEKLQELMSRREKKNNRFIIQPPPNYYERLEHEKDIDSRVRNWSPKKPNTDHSGDHDQASRPTHSVSDGHKSENAGGALGDTARIGEIKRICAERDIRNLVHFTRIKNLTGILTYGLIDRNTLDLELLETPFVPNDENRLDGQKSAVCLSISFPNHLMFKKYKMDFDSRWAVILLRPSILWERDCAFFSENAASKQAGLISIDERRKGSQLSDMFCENYAGISRASLDIPTCYATNPQAEVLVFGGIPTSYIETVHFYTIDSIDEWRRDNPNFRVDVRKPKSSGRLGLRWSGIKNDGSIVLSSPLIENQEYFYYRKDSEYWKEDY